jgi:Skp family chaperone for outer membrane proteins
MRTSRFAVITSLLAGLAALSAWTAGTATAQDGAQPAAATSTIKMATLDIFSLAERMMNRDDLKAPRTAIDEKYRPQFQSVEQRVQDLNARLQQLERTPSDPQVRPLLEQREQAFQQYQELMQQSQGEKEALNATQLGAVYREIREAAQAHAQRNGFSHVVANRSAERAVQPATVGDALQDMLARPMIVAPAGDDITAAIATTLNVDLTAPLPAPAEQPAPAPQNQPPAPAPAPQR